MPEPATLTGYLLDSVAPGILQGVKSAYDMTTQTGANLLTGNLFTNTDRAKAHYVDSHTSRAKNVVEFVHKALPTAEDAAYATLKTGARIAETAGRFTRDPILQGAAILGHNIVQGIQKQRHVDQYNSGELRRVTQDTTGRYDMISNPQTGITKAYLKPMTRQQWLTAKALERQQHKLYRPMLKRNYMSFARVYTPYRRKYTRYNKKKMWYDKSKRRLVEAPSTQQQIHTPKVQREKRYRMASPYNIHTGRPHGVTKRPPKTKRVYKITPRGFRRS